MRAGGILALSGFAEETVFSERARTEREFQLFPLPSSAKIFSSQSQSEVFTLIEDDGRSNDATKSGKFNEIDISFSTNANPSDLVQVKISPRRTAFSGIWEWQFILPKGDQRKLRLEENVAIAHDVQLLQNKDESCRLGMRIVVA